MSPDFMADLSPEERRQVFLFLAMLDEYKTAHTEQEFDLLADGLIDNRLQTFRQRHRLALVIAHMKEHCERNAASSPNKIVSDNAPRVYKSDNPLGIEVEANDWGTLARVVATRKELIDSKLCAEYMFDELGKRSKRSGPTEYGDRFKLEKRANGRYDMTLWLYPKAKKPYGMGHIDMSQTDISALLKQISGGAS